MSPFDSALGDVYRHGERSRTMTSINNFQIRTAPNSQCLMFDLGNIRATALDSFFGITGWRLAVNSRSMRDRFHDHKSS